MAAAASPLLFLALLSAMMATSSPGAAAFSTSSTTTMATLAANRPGRRGTAAARGSLDRVVGPLCSDVQKTASSLDWTADDDEGEGDKPTSDAAPAPMLTGSLAGAVLLEYELTEHKPLGCSVEESLAAEPDGAKYVFVAEITRGGNAVKGGLKEGDVIVQLSGTFDEVVDVTGLGIEKM